MIKHKKVNRELLQKTLGENGIKATPTVRSGQTAKLVMTGEDGKVYEVNKDLTVVRVQDEMPARPLLKTHSQSPADRSAVQIRKAAMRTSKYEAVHQSIARHNEAWKNQQRQLDSVKKSPDAAFWLSIPISIGIPISKASFIRPFEGGYSFLRIRSKAFIMNLSLWLFRRKKNFAISF